jgi:predicted TIM-barrel fold metal-dependent hydrolase
VWQEALTMDELIQAIHTTPIIDNHAHPLLKPSAIDKYPLLAITTEAHGPAIHATKSSLSHIRAVNQLSEVLKCEATWAAVEKAIHVQREKNGLEWEKRCFNGIETLLIDDGLDGADEVFEYGWHDELVRSGCKRIVRIEKVAENIIQHILRSKEITADEAYFKFVSAFRSSIMDAIADPEVVGFKSVICYRAGLEIQDIDMSAVGAEIRSILQALREKGIKDFQRIEEPAINSALVTYTARLISDSAEPRKPFQFHTGLGDNDITLTKSSPSHMQPFIRKYPKVPIVLLHASYPWTKEAGYLATVYENVYADVGEVFPFLSQEGQERVIREILELCPSQKICWSTDGHWFPETYLLAVTQVKEALEVVSYQVTSKHLRADD